MASDESRSSCSNSCVEASQSEISVLPVAVATFLPSAVNTAAVTGSRWVIGRSCMEPGGHGPSQVERSAGRHVPEANRSIAASRRQCLAIGAKATLQTSARWPRN